MFGENAFQMVDDSTGRSVGKLPDNWKLAVLVGYQEVLVSLNSNKSELSIYHW